MQTGPCTSQQAFIQQVQELQKSEALPPPKEVEIFLQNNTKWLEQLRSNPAVGSSLIDVSKRIRATTINHDEAKRVADYVQGIAETMRPSDELLAQIMSMSLGGASPTDRTQVAQSGSIGRDEKARETAKKINETQEWPSLIGKGSTTQAVAFIQSLGPYLEYLNLTKIPLTSAELLQIATACPNITSLTCDSPHLDADVSRALAKWDKVEVIDLRFSGIKDLVIENMPALKKCYMGGKDASLENLTIKNVPKLTFLNVECSPDLKMMHVENLPELAEVYGYSCGDLQTLTLGQGLNKLTSLNLPDCEALQRLLLNSVGALRELYIKGCEALRSLDVSSTPNLEVLDISSTSLTTVQGLAQAKGLKELYVAYCDSLDQEFLDEFASVIKND